MKYTPLPGRFVAGFLLALFMAPALSQTLFIDLNNAEQEIRAFGGRPGELSDKLVVLPGYVRISPAQRAAARQANTALETHTELAKECAVLSGPRSDRCQRVYSDISRAEAERQAATGNYSVTDLKDELGSLLSAPRAIRFDTLVVSGHHENGYFNGELTQATENELAALLAIQGSALRFKTVVLLGCNTGTRNALSAGLASMFPQARLVVGAQGNAPTRDEARNLSFLRKLVRMKPALLTAGTQREVQALYSSLLTENWPVSLLWRRKTVFFAESTNPY